MGLTGDRYVGTYEGHKIELVMNNWNKAVMLLIDENEVTRESRFLPRNITLSGTLEHDGVQHTVVARSVVRFPWTEDTIEIDGKVLILTKTK